METLNTLKIFFFNKRLNLAKAIGHVSVKFCHFAQFSSLQKLTSSLFAHLEKFSLSFQVRRFLIRDFGPLRFITTSLVFL